MFDMFWWRLYKMNPTKRKKDEIDTEDMENEVACDSND